jgi:hypothetical protein
VSDGDVHQRVRAIARKPPHGPRWFNITYCTRCKIYTTQRRHVRSRSRPASR